VVGCAGRVIVTSNRDEFTIVGARLASPHAYSLTTQPSDIV
jgi:hypothetical protein